MLLIGSRAARLRIPGFRDPLDWDFVARPEELGSFSALEPVRADSGKAVFRYGRTYVEVELALPGTSAELLLSESDGSTGTPFGPAPVASVDALLLLKRSHIWSRRMWLKHFRDYKVLQVAAGCVPARLQPVLDLRVLETRRRLGYRDHDFSVTNEEFFKRSAGRVRRHVVHDDIHEAVKLGPVPVFKLLKEDQSSADVSYARFLALPFDQKVRNMQEECMVLTLERHAIPARLDGRLFCERHALEQVLREMCFNFLPFDFRPFCVDWFYEILDGVPRGFAERAMDALGVSRGGRTPPAPPPDPGTSGATPS